MSCSALRERFTESEIQTGVVALAGLERLYTQLEERDGPHDDRLVMAIQNVKAMFQGAPAAAEVQPQPIPMLLWCPECCDRHIDEGEFATKSHHTHACQKCGHVWRPAIVPTLGVQFLPGFKNDEEAGRT